MQDEEAGEGKKRGSKCRPALCCAVRQCIIWRLPSNNILHEKGPCTDVWIQGSLMEVYARLVGRTPALWQHSIHKKQCQAKHTCKAARSAPMHERHSLKPAMQGFALQRSRLGFDHNMPAAVLRLPHV